MIYDNAYCITCGYFVKTDEYGGVCRVNPPDCLCGEKLFPSVGEWCFCGKYELDRSRFENFINMLGWMEKEHAEMYVGMKGR